MKLHSSQRLRIIVGGMVGQFPLGGVAWDYFHYVLGLAELGHDVYYHEDTWVWPFDPEKRHPSDDPHYSVGFIRGFFDRYAPHLSDHWHYLLLHDSSHGMNRTAFDEVAKSADVFLNVSGACFFPDNLNPKCIKVFVDTDPGYNQIRMAERFAWEEHVDRWIAQVRSHDRHLTYAEALYRPECTIPRLDLDWKPTRCIATAEPWKSLDALLHPDVSPFTTVMSWDYFKGALIHDGREYHAKVPEYERFRKLPRQVAYPMELAIGGHKCPTDEVAADGWLLTDAFAASRTPESYVDYIARSRGEWSIAKNVYVDTFSGWFSCRTACYLAAGRPAVVQDTGWSRFLPSGSGLHAFSTMDEAIAGLDRIASQPANEAQAALAIAREYLAPDRVLPPMLEAIFAPIGNSAASSLPPSVEGR